MYSRHQPHLAADGTPDNNVTRFVVANLDGAIVHAGLRLWGAKGRFVRQGSQRVDGLPGFGDTLGSLKPPSNSSRLTAWPVRRGVVAAVLPCCVAETGTGRTSPNQPNHRA